MRVLVGQGCVHALAKDSTATARNAGVPATAVREGWMSRWPGGFLLSAPWGQWRPEHSWLTHAADLTLVETPHRAPSPLTTRNPLEAWRLYIILHDSYKATWRMRFPWVNGQPDVEVELYSSPMSEAPSHTHPALSPQTWILISWWHLPLKISWGNEVVFGKRGWRSCCSSSQIFASARPRSSSRPPSYRRTCDRTRGLTLITTLTRIPGLVFTCTVPAWERKSHFSFFRLV